MSTVSGQNGYITTSCCHPSPAVHTTEMALLAALISEHRLLNGILDYPNSSPQQIFGLLEAYDVSAEALARWKAAAV